MRRTVLLVAAAAATAGVVAVAVGAFLADGHSGVETVAGPLLGARPAGSGQARWVIRDLGVLPGRDRSEAVAVNDRGQVVGYGYTTRSEWNGGIRGYGPTQTDRMAFLWENGKLRALGTLGGKESSVISINGRGQVAGNAATGAKDDGGEPITHAFLWQSGKMTDLGSLGNSYSFAAALNEQGQVVGSSGKGFLWENGAMRDLGNLGAVAINARGQVIGGSETDREDGSIIDRAFFWENGKLSDLGSLCPPDGSPCDPYTNAYALNERGQVVGRSGEFPNHAFLWQDGKMTDLGTLGGFESEALSINDRGQVVGEAEAKDAAGDDFSHAFLWEGGRMRDLGTLDGYSSVAVAINEKGQIIGSVTRTSGSDPGVYIPRGDFSEARAFVWEDGKMTDLATLGGRESGAVSINERNQIVGWATTRTGRKHAVLWTLRP
jgi:probable HAF family extracellular repeat protein